MDMTSQLGRFAGVGVVATLTHVIVALIAEGLFGAAALLANLTGFCAAVGVSYFGHAHLTFGVTDLHGVRLTRFVVVALAGLVTSSAITLIVHDQMGASFAVTMFLVAVVVPIVTFSGSKLWVFGSIGARADGRWTGWVIAFIAALIFVALFLDRYINHDTGWYLVAVRKWLEQGAAIHVDLIEVNPPLNFYLTVPAIWLADAFGLSDPNGQYVFVALVLAASLIWVWHLLCADDRLSERNRQIVLIGVAAALIVPALDNAAQREHLMLILMMPWFVGYLTLDRPDQRGGAVARAAVAAVGLCLKPHFMVFPVLLTLVLVWRRRSLRPIVSPANLTVFSVGLAYVALVALRHPQYLNDIVPMAMHVYGAYGFGPEVVLQRLQPVLICLFLVVVLIARGAPVRPHGLAVLTAGVLAAVICYLLQWTGYGYQAMPIISLIIVGCVWIMIQPGVPRTLVVGVVATLAVTTSVSLQKGFYKSPATEAFAPLIAPLGENVPLMTLSSSLWPSFPLVLETNAVWTSRYPALWLVPGAVNGLAGTDCAVQADKCAALQAISDRTRDDILADIAEGRPQLLIIDNDPLYFDDGPFDYRAFLAVDPRFADLIGGYETYHETERFTVLKSKTGPGN